MDIYGPTPDQTVAWVASHWPHTTDLIRFSCVFYCSTIYYTKNKITSQPLLNRFVSIISLKFDNIDELVDIEFYSTVNAEFFKNFLLGFNRPADRIFPPPNVNNLSTFLNKARRAVDMFKFDWDLTNVSQDNFNKWHRDIETFDLSKHPPWSQEKGDFFIDLHTFLHAAESDIVSKIISLPATGWRDIIKIKWFEKSIPWPEIPKFKSRLDIESGDIITDYPHVGKSPWICYKQNDSANLKQFCRLPDACPPGFDIILTGKRLNADFKRNLIEKRQQQLIEWYQQNINQVGSLFTQDQMLTYDGVYCVGRLKNIEQVSFLQTANLTSVSIVAYE